jgi:hypothetical protein
MCMWDDLMRIPAYQERCVPSKHLKSSEMPAYDEHRIVFVSTYYHYTTVVEYHFICKSGQEATIDFPTYYNNDTWISSSTS